MQEQFGETRHAETSRPHGRRLNRRTVLGGLLAGTGAVLLHPLRAFAMVAPVLSAGTITDTSVQLNWTDAGDEQSYNIYKNSVLLVKRGANTLTYTATGLIANTTYSFRVDAKKGGTTVQSNTLPVTTTGGGGSPPTVDSFSPTNGVVGTAVTVTGTNFTGATATKFNGTSASFSVTDAQHIATTVPTGATTGPISVTTPNGTGTSATNFTVTTGGGGFDVYDDSYGAYP